MPKKHHKTHRHKDKHHSTSKSSRKHKHEHNEDSKKVKDIFIGKLKVDENACGDYVQPPTSKKDNSGTEHLKKSRISKEKYSSKKNSIVDSKRLTEKAVRHHSLENNENSIIKTTKLLFRKEKSFNDAILKSTTEPKIDDKEKKREKKHKHHSRKVEDRKKPKSETLDDKTKELKEKRDKSHKEKHKSKNNSPHRDGQTFNRVQEVIFCQVNQTPYKLKNDKPHSELKELCRQQKREHKHSEERCRNNEQKCYRPITDFTVGSVEPEHFKVKTRENPESEQYIAQTQYADFHSKSKRSKEHHQRHSSKTNKQLPFQDFNLSEISLNFNEKSLMIAEQEKQHEKHHHRHEGKTERHKKHEGHSKNRQSSEFKSEASQVEEQKIHKIVENDLKSYFGKIQNLIDKKLDAILHIKQTKQGDSSVKSERSRSGTKEKKSRKDKVKEPGKVDGVSESDRITKEELVKEVLKYLKENDNSLITCKRKKLEKVGENSPLNTSKETYQTEDSKCKEQRQLIDKNIEEPTKGHARKHDKTRRSEPLQDFFLSSHKHHRERRSFEREAPTKMLDSGQTQLPPKKHKNLVDLSVKHYNSASSSRSFSEQNVSASLDPMLKPYLCSASEETVRQKCQEDHRRSSSPSRFLTQMHKSPVKSEKTPPQENRQKDTKRGYLSISPPRCPSTQAMPFLQNVFLPPENFRSPPKNQFIVQGVEPPISDLKSFKRGHVKKLECKTMSIVAIKSQKRPNELSILTQTQANIKTCKPSKERELVERKKLSKRFKLYYNYSGFKTDNDEDERSIVSDSARVVSDPSEEVCLRENLKQPRRPLKVGELEILSIPKKWNRISTPRNSYLNNIIEEPSEIKNDDYFVPLIGDTEEVYRRTLTSSHSDYCFKIDRKQANSNVSIQSREIEYGAEPVNINLERTYKPQKSRSDCQLTTNVRRRHPVYISKSDIFLDGNCGKKVMKTIFLADTRRFAPKIKPRSSSNVKKKDAHTTFSKECQTTDVESVQQNITKTRAALEENIFRKIPILTTNVAVSSHLLDTKVEDNEIINKGKTPETVDTAVGPPENKFKSCHVVDIAVGTSEVKLPVKPNKVQRKKIEIRTRKSTAVSPIRFTEDGPAHNPPKSPIRKFVVQKPQNPVVPKLQNQTKTKPPLERSPLRTPQTPRVAEIKRTQCITPKPILVTPRVTKALEATLTPEETCVRLFHSKEKNINFSTKKSQATKGASEKPSATSAFKHTETKKSCNTPSVVESCFLHCDPTKKDSLETGTASKHPIIVGTATCGFQPGAKIASAEGSTSSSVSDADPRPIRRSKSLVEVDNAKKINLDKSKSEICRIKKVLISNLLNTRDNSFISERMEKFANKPNLRCTSKSHGSSLDNYIKGKFTSRLFLTKDYKAGAISSYQKRKLYDEARRQKMKKNFSFRKDVEVGPQVFEVHFLSMINQSKQTEQSLQAPVVNYTSRCVVPTDDQSSKNHLDKVQTNYSQRIVVDENPQLKTICKKIMGLSGFDTELLKGTTCTCSEVSKQCSSCKAFVALMDKLHASLEKYRTDPGHSCKTIEPEEPTTQLQKIVEIYPTCFNKSSNESAPAEVASAFNIVDSDKPIIQKVKSSHDDLILIPQPMSCPVLATNSSSFEFLYEETTSLENEPLVRDALLADLLKPFDQSFNLNTNQYNVEMPYFHTASYGSTTVSIESGYGSIKSKNCCANSFASFFKKPNISALFRPPSSNSNPSEIRSGADERSLVYEKMTKSCQLYAKKVRAVSEMKIEGNTEEFQEFSLKFLLSNDGSVLLGSGVSVLSLRSVSQQNINESIEVAPTDAALLDGFKGYNVVFPNESLNTHVSIYLHSDVIKNEKKPSNIPLDIKSSSVMYGEFLAALTKAYDAEMAVCNLLLDDKDADCAITNALRHRKNEEKSNRKLKKFFSKKSIDTRKEFDETVSQVEVFNDKSVIAKLQHLATNSRKCFTMLADAVKINDGIDNELKICGLLKMLQRMESGDFVLEQVRDTEPETCVRSQVLQSIIALYELELKDSKKLKKKNVSEKLKLLKLLVIKYRVGLLYKTDAIVVLIWRGVISTESQLKAAVMFLLRSNTANIDLKQLEEYCKCTK